MFLAFSQREKLMGFVKDVVDIKNMICQTLMTEIKGYNLHGCVVLFKRKH